MRAAGARMFSMDPVLNAENSQNPAGWTKKFVIILIVAIMAGALMGAGAMFLLFRNTLQNAVIFNAPAPTATNNLSYPPVDDRKAFDATTTPNIVLSKELVGPSYFPLVGKIANELQLVGTNNISTLVPLMNSIKQKGIAGDFNGFFNLVTQAKDEIKKNTAILAATHKDIAAMRVLNDQTVKDMDIHKQTNVLLDASDVFIQEFSGYFATLDETLSGSIPTQDLLDRLAHQVTIVQNAGSSMQAEFTALITLMQQKASSTKPQG